METGEKIRKHRVEDFVMTVESGMTFGLLQHILSKARQFFPLIYPEQMLLCEIFSQDLHSLESAFHGLPRDYVLGLEVATPSGQLLHCGGEVMKNVTGYDLNKLYVGSANTLSVITAITLSCPHYQTPDNPGFWVLRNGPMR